MAQRIRKGDLVQVVAGADRGKQGKVLSVRPSVGTLRIDKVRVQKHHLKPGRRGARAGKSARIAWTRSAPKAGMR